MLGEYSPCLQGFQAQWEKQKSASKLRSIHWAIKEDFTEEATFS